MLFPIWIFLGCLLTGLSGCQIVEPEKRAYPLVVGIDRREGQYQIFLAMAHLAESTGQGKESSEGQDGDGRGAVLITGTSRDEIMELYNRTQELYLDPGHVQAVIFGSSLLSDKECMAQVLRGMEAENGMGNSAYVFAADDPGVVFAANGNLVESLGKYLAGIYENRTGKNQPVILSQMYNRIHNTGDVQEIPAIAVRDDQIVVEEK